MAALALDVVFINPYLSGGAPAPDFSDANLAWLFDLNERRSIARLWSESSGGLVEMAPTFHPRLDVEVTQDTLDILQAGGGRRAATKEVLRLFTEAGGQLTDSGHLVIFVGVKGLDGGAFGTTLNGKFLHVAYLDFLGDHTFMAHEIGHAMGFEHPFDTRISGGLGMQEYGDPGDIMSAYRFGAERSATFTIPQDEREFSPDSAFWVTAGPGASPVSLFRFRPDFPTVPSWARRIEADAAPARFTIDANDVPIDTGTHLVVMPGDRGATWYAVQYKRKSGWDRAIYPGLGEVTGVVQIHELRTMTWPKDANGYIAVDSEVPNLIGELPLPGLDRDFSNGRISVRVENFNDRSATLLIGHWLPGLRSAALDLSVDVINHQQTGTGQFVDVGRTGPSCAVTSYMVQRITSQAQLVATPSTAGYDHPRLRFSVNGVAVAESWVTSDDTISGGITVPAVVTVPTGYLKSRVEQRQLLCDFWIEHGQLTLVTPLGDGRYELTVALEVAEADSTTPASSAVATETVETKSITLPTEVIQDQARCFRARLFHVTDETQWKIPLEHPDWQVPLDLGTLLQTEHPALAAPALVGIARAAAIDPRAERQLNEAAADLQISPEVLKLATKDLA